MITTFILKKERFNAAELRGWKELRSQRADYGDKAINFVQLKKEGDVTSVVTHITPEHSIHATAYTVTASIKTRESEISQAACNSCAASQGGYKHLIAFLSWLHRRSEEPSPTQVVCYWKKSALSSTGTVSAKDFKKGEKSNTASKIVNAAKVKPISLISMMEKHSERSSTTILYRHFATSNQCFNLDIHSLIQWRISAFLC